MSLGWRLAAGAFDFDVDVDFDFDFDFHLYPFDLRFSESGIMNDL